MTGRRIIGTVPGGLLLHDPQKQILWILPDPKAESDPTVASALALRNRATLEGICPGCEGVERSAVAAIVIEHDADCPAGTDRLRRLMQPARRVPRRRGSGDIS